MHYKIHIQGSQMDLEAHVLLLRDAKEIECIHKQLYPKKRALIVTLNASFYHTDQQIKEAIRKSIFWLVRGSSTAKIELVSDTITVDYTDGTPKTDVFYVSFSKHIIITKMDAYYENGQKRQHGFSTIYPSIHTLVFYYYQDAYDLKKTIIERVKAMHPKAKNISVNLPLSYTQRPVNYRILVSCCVYPESLV